MRILLLVHSFNSLSQRLYVELAREGHELSVEFDIHDRVTCEAAERFQPDVVLAPILKRAIPEALWRRRSVPHRAPGTARRSRSKCTRLGDSARRSQLGGHGAEANAEFDAGPVWAERLL